MRIPSVLLSIFYILIPCSANPSKEDQLPILQKNAKPTLADLLTIERSVSIFYTYARETELSSLFSDEKSRLTLFAPTDKAVKAMSRKPHLSPPTADEIELSQEEFDRRSKSNVERWISAHIVPEYPLSLDSIPHKTLLKGKSISFMPNSKDSESGPDWKRISLDNGAKIIGKKEGSNGDLFIVDTTVSID